MKQTNSIWIKRICVFFLTFGLILSAVSVFAQTSGEKEGSPSTEMVEKTEADQSPLSKAGGLLAAAVAFGMGALGAGIGIAYVGSAAMGAMAERPELRGQALIFVALAEGIIVFAFIALILILAKV